MQPLLMSMVKAIGNWYNMSPKLTGVDWPTGRHREDGIVFDGDHGKATYFSVLRNEDGIMEAHPHKAVDFLCPIGTPCYAMEEAEVYLVHDDPEHSMGKYIVLKHDSGVFTLYAHLSFIMVQRGQRVRMGQQVAETGDTGECGDPHLHLSMGYAVWNWSIDPATHPLTRHHIVPMPYKPAAGKSSSMCAAWPTSHTSRINGAYCHDTLCKQIDQYEIVVDGVCDDIMDVQLIHTAKFYRGGWDFPVDYIDEDDGTFTVVPYDVIDGMDTRFSNQKPEANIEFRDGKTYITFTMLQGAIPGMYVFQPKLGVSAYEPVRIRVA